MSRLFLVSGALLAGLAVAAGAFGGHLLKRNLTPDMLAVFETAVRYQMYHALGLLIVGKLAAGPAVRWVAWAGWGFVVGILLFSGSLYLLSLTGTRWYGAITPLGGVAFLMGWGILAWGVWKDVNR